MIELQNIQNPVNILQQPKSQIITNPFIIPPQDIQHPKSVQKTSTFTTFNQNISKSVIGILDDLLQKPKDISWFEYIPAILKKEQRYFYLGVLFLFLAFLFLAFR